ncbi:MAG: hypothetical protein ACKVQA_24705 [Burkholderiales bacterium]
MSYKALLAAVWVVYPFAEIGIILFPHHGLNASRTAGVGLSFLHASQILLFYVLCRLLASDGKKHTKRRLFWLTFEKVFCVAVVAHVVVHYSGAAIIESMRFWFAILALIDPLDFFGVLAGKMSPIQSERLLNGICPAKRSSVLHYVGAFVGLAIIYWLMIGTGRGF